MGSYILADFNIMRGELSLFRGCYFEYAGKSSDIYDLQLFYYDRQENMFNSGGEYEIKTEVLPKVPEQLLYGINYSEKPLEFDIEILSEDRAIPFEQVIEIKNWLFGQDGWKTFRTLDERQDYHLKCMLIPEEDIVDALGYRGFKCKLRNISPFWYGSERTITIGEDILHNPDIVQGSIDGYKWVPLEIDISHDNASNSHSISPTISVESILRNATSDTSTIFDLGATNYLTKEDFLSSANNKTPSVEGYVHNNNFSLWEEEDLSSGISFNLITLAGSVVARSYFINTRYASVAHSSVGLKDEMQAIGCKAGKRLFRLKAGKNICYLRNPENIKSIQFTYTPTYRLGAF